MVKNKTVKIVRKKTGAYMPAGTRNTDGILYPERYESQKKHALILLYIAFEKKISNKKGTQERVCETNIVYIQQQKR